MRVAATARHVTAVLVAVVLGLACDTGRIRGVEERLEVSSRALHFPDTFVGHARALSLNVTNAGPRERTVELVMPQGPFGVEPSLRLGAGERRRLVVRFAPELRGTAEARLVLRSGEEELVLVLTGLGREPLTCQASTACVRARFDAESGRCVEEPLADGLACEEPCVSDGQCRSGRCVGRGVTCDDGNACTQDACGPTGCVHSPLPLPESGPEQACQAPVCDPDTGIRWADVPDGTRCPGATCGAWQVCIAGACAARPDPVEVCGVEAVADAETPACTIETFRPDGSLAEREAWAAGPVPLDAARIFTSLRSSGVGLRWRGPGRLLEREAPQATGEVGLRQWHGYSAGREVLRRIEAPTWQTRVEWRYNGPLLVLRREYQGPWPKLLEVYRHYGAWGRLERIDYLTNTTLQQWRVATYGGTGLLERMTWQDASGETCSHETYTYLPDGRLSRIEYQNCVTAWGVTYDAEGHLLSIDSPDSYASRYWFAYDGSGRLTFEASRWSWPEGWGQSSVTYAYDASGRLEHEVSWSKRTGYDGERQEERVRTFHYRDDGRLLEVLEDVNGDGAPDGLRVLSYDAAGQPVSETLSGSLAAPDRARREFSAGCPPPSPLPPMPEWVDW